jgi:hypothetical protein
MFVIFNYSIITSTGVAGVVCNTTVTMIMQPTQQLTVPLQLTYI